MPDPFSTPFVEDMEKASKKKAAKKKTVKKKPPISINSDVKQGE